VDFDLTDEQQRFRDRVGGLAREQLTPVSSIPSRRFLSSGWLGHEGTSEIQRLTIASALLSV